MSEFENLLMKLLNGETADIIPQSRLEQYLKNCCDKCGCDGLPTPQTRGEILLYQLAEQLASGGGGSGESVSKLAQLVDKTVTEITAKDLEGATKIGERAFYQCGALKSVVIPSGVQTIGKEAFLYSGVTSVIIPDTVLEIQNSAFNSARSLERINIPDSVKSMQADVFSYCSRLTSVTIGKGLSSIVLNTFSCCTILADIIIPDNIGSIGTNAFRDCTALKSVTVEAETPPTIQSSTFSGVPSDCAFYVPAASVEAYKAATNWSARADYIFAIEE